MPGEVGARWSAPEAEGLAGRKVRAYRRAEVRQDVSARPLVGPVQRLFRLGVGLGHLSAKVEALLGVAFALRGGVERLFLVGRVTTIVGVD